METQTIQELQFIVRSDGDPPVLSVPVALARVAMRPVREFEVIHRPEGVRFAWVRYALWAGLDPYLPVPLVDFGERFFWNLHLFADHLEAWSPDLDAERQRRWSQAGYDVIHGFQGTRGALDLLTDAERRWLLAALWSLWATPQGPVELLAELRGPRVEQRRRYEETRRAQEAAARQREAQRRADHEAKTTAAYLKQKEMEQAVA